MNDYLKELVEREENIIKAFGYAVEMLANQYPYGIYDSDPKTGRLKLLMMSGNREHEYKISVDEQWMFIVIEGFGCEAFQRFSDIYYNTLRESFRFSNAEMKQFVPIKLSLTKDEVDVIVTSIGALLNTSEELNEKIKSAMTTLLLKIQKEIE